MVLVVALNGRPSEEGYYPRHDVKGPNRRSMRISESTISKDLSQLNQLFLWVSNHLMLFDDCIFRPFAMDNMLIRNLIGSSERISLMNTDTCFYPVPHITYRGNCKR